MDIKYICTFWGCEQQSAKEFLTKVIDNGYDGVEINFPADDHFILEFKQELEIIRNTTHQDFIFIAQQVLPNKQESVDEYIERFTDRLKLLTSLNPNYINSHTGKDYYDFNDNCRIIELAGQISKESGIPIWHEIHRGRFSFHLKTLLKYLTPFPEINLIADFSHFSVVSESDLNDQQEFLSALYPNIKHIHARVGFEQSPQLNNPFAPEWSAYLAQYLRWWKEIIEIQENRNRTMITITPECGPYPYMPQEPFSQNPLANQWEINLQMKKYLQQNLS